MSINNHIVEILERRKREAGEVASCLIEYPNCMQGDPHKENAYHVAMQYFIEKQENSKWPGEVSYNNRGVIALQVMLDCYEEAQGEQKKKSARKIARSLIDSHEWYLMRIPDEMKEKAFQIAIQYLEEQKCS